ncbi:hypothetical protein KFE25_007804 [Diacronema lutheri]|uniref:Uncharacterized protein n=1 Tax=Diacronema lutheri TaxID=2081491 RepID=A0A8J5XHX6_DIALT|nr:hypothetical protein KFE25_007804 [Diacronema lutheri]
MERARYRPARDERVRLLVTTLGAVIAIYMLAITAADAYNSAGSRGLAVSFSLPDARTFAFRCDRRAQNVRLDVYRLSADGNACTQYCLPDTQKHLANAARSGLRLGGNCGQHGCTAMTSAAGGPASYPTGVQQFVFACNATEQAAQRARDAAEPSRVVSCSRFGALSTVELTQAAQRDGSGWACAASARGACFNIGIPRSRGCPLGFTWLGMMCYKPCPPGFQHSSLCSCRMSASPP